MWPEIELPNGIEIPTWRKCNENQLLEVLKRKESLIEIGIFLGGKQKAGRENERKGSRKRTQRKKKKKSQTAEIGRKKIKLGEIIKYARILELIMFHRLTIRIYTI